MTDPHSDIPSADYLAVNPGRGDESGTEIIHQIYQRMELDRYKLNNARERDPREYISRRRYSL